MRAIAIACLMASVTPACGLLKSAVDAPGKVTSAVLRTSKPPRMAPDLVQIGVMRFTDRFMAELTQATQDFSQRAATPEARIQAMSWWIEQSTSALTIATGENSYTSLLDLVVLVTLGRIVHEEHWIKVWGESDRPMVASFIKLEADVWSLAAGVLTEAEQGQVRLMLRQWRESNPDLAVSAFVRLSGFREVMTTQSAKSTNLLGDLASLVSVDPLLGLEPAMREVLQARLFAERTMFYLQRAPILLSTQMELLGLKLTRLPEIRSALESGERISQAAASIARTADDLAKTAAGLPDNVRTEREAAVKQIADELTAQRQGLIADLEAAQAPTRQILVDASTTLTAGAQMSTALQGAIESLDRFVGRFDKPEPSGQQAPEETPSTVPQSSDPPSPSAAPGKPFDVTDYGDAAARVGVAARDLNGLITTLDQSLPQVQRVFDEAAQRGQSTVDYAFRRSLQLGGILLAATSLAVLLVRRISSCKAYKGV